MVGVNTGNMATLDGNMTIPIYYNRNPPTRTNFAYWTWACHNCVGSCNWASTAALTLRTFLSHTLTLQAHYHHKHVNVEQSLVDTTQIIFRDSSETWIDGKICNSTTAVLSDYTVPQKYSKHLSTPLSADSSLRPWPPFCAKRTNVSTELPRRRTHRNIGKPKTQSQRNYVLRP